MKSLLLTCTLPILLITSIATSALGQGSSQFIEVVADGTGLTSKTALEDAYRSAVQQVVGAYVDAETLIKNDKLVEDKVLTYSDGFVKTYDEISVRKKDGLVRIKILAKIERRSVIAKLKAANITIKKLDGKGLFAEAVTNMEAEKGATALLKKALADFPTLVTAESAGKPEFDRDTSEVVIDVLLKVDTKAYTSHQKRLEEMLAKICLDKSSLLIKSGALPNTRMGITQKVQKPGINPHFRVTNMMRDEVEVGQAIVGPLLSSKIKNGWTVWVNSSRNATHTSTRWNGYVVDADVVECLESLNGQDIFNVALLDASGEVITEDEFELVDIGGSQFGLYKAGGWDNQYPFVRAATWGAIPKRGGAKRSTMQAVLKQLDQIKQRPESIPQKENYGVNLYISPYSLSIASFTLRFQSQLVVQRRIKVTLDELKQVADIKCKMEYRPRKEAKK